MPGHLQASSFPPSPISSVFRNQSTQLPSSYLNLIHPFHSFAVAYSPAQDAANREMPSLPRAGPEGSTRHAASKQVGPDARSSGKALDVQMALVPSVSLSLISTLEIPGELPQPPLDHVFLSQLPCLGKVQELILDVEQDHQTLRGRRARGPRV